MILLRTLVCVVLFACVVLLISCDSAEQTSAPVKVIFDTDMGPDYDDVGAIALLHAFADAGEADILATVASTNYEGVVAVLNVLNTYFNRPDIPVGVPTGQAVNLRDHQHWSDTLIAKYPHALRENSAARDAVSLYRAVLASQPDTSVTIVTVGFLTNMANLLKSGPDDISPLSGRELVDRKVKRLVSMAGKFPEGKEFNVIKDAASAKYAFENFPRPILFSGFEIGSKIKSGLPLISNDGIQNSPVKDVFSISIPQSEEDKAGRMSWDQTAVLVAVEGHLPFYEVRKGTIVVEDDGANRWRETGKNHAYLVEKHTPAEVEKLINELMMHQPK